MANVDVPICLRQSDGKLIAIDANCDDVELPVCMNASTGLLWVYHADCDGVGESDGWFQVCRAAGGGLQITIPDDCCGLGVPDYAVSTSEGRLFYGEDLGIAWPQSDWPSFFAAFQAGALGSFRADATTELASYFGYRNAAASTVELYRSMWAFFMGGYLPFTITNAMKAAAAEVYLHVTGYHAYFVNGSAPVGVDSGTAKVQFTESASSFSDGGDLFDTISPVATLNFSDLNALWIAASEPFSDTPAEACYADIAVPLATITGMTGNTLYLWYAYDDSAFPWRDDYVGNSGQEKERLLDAEIWIFQ
ncbi:MAG TPA: hypothetical protein VM487_02210 [Phycisphaerae bacterium]|nr:hypothetical protein [Phycisphaerae bacterium]